MNKKFIGLFLVTFTLVTNATPAAKKLTIIREAADPSQVVALDSNAHKFAMNQGVMVVIEHKEKNANAQQLSTLRQADPRALGLQATHWKPKKQQKDVGPKGKEDQDSAIFQGAPQGFIELTPAAISLNPDMIYGEKAKKTESTVEIESANTDRTQYIGLQEAIKNQEIKEYNAYKKEKKERRRARFFNKHRTKRKDPKAELVEDSKDLKAELANSAHHYAWYGEEQHLAFKMIEQESNLFYAVEENNLDLLKKCLENEENANLRDARGNTPLHYAADIACIQELLKCGAHVNTADTLGNTPLHYAVTRNSLKCVQYLIEQGGAFVLLVNNKNETPYDIAIKYGYDAIIQYFESLEKSDMKSEKSKSKKHTRHKSKKSEKKEKADIDTLVENTAKLSLSDDKRTKASSSSSKPLAQ